MTWLRILGGVLFAAFLSASATGQTRDFNIPAGELKVVLDAFVKQSGTQLVYRADEISSAQSKGVTGSLSNEAALARILEGTGFTTLRDSSGAIAIVRAKDQALKPAVGAAEPQRAQLDGVTITAQKRVETVMTAPLSVTALDNETIRNRGLVSLDDFLRSIPAVAYVDQGPGQNIIVIRGAYGEPFATGPTVGMYFGEVPLTGLAIGASADVKLVDMERVEVLRGPQGTLYGSNSLSGTIRHVPAPPKFSKFEGRLDVGYSDTTRYGGHNGDVVGMLNVPLLDDRLAVRAVAYKFSKTGFIKNIAGDDPRLQASAAFFGASNQAGNQSHVGGSTIEGARVSVLWKPIDDLRIGFIYVRQNDAADDRPFSQRGLGEYERSVYRFGPIVGEDDALKTSLDIKNLTVEYQTRWGSFLSSTAIVNQDYRRLWQIGNFFPVMGFIPPVPQDSITNARLVTEEARFTSNFGGPVEFVAGVYYEDSEQPTAQPTFYTGDPARNPFVPIFGQIYRTDIDRQYKQIAGFGELSYSLLPNLKLTAGARLFKYDTTFISNTVSTNNARVPTVSFTGDASESGQTYKVGADYKPTDKTLVYAKYSQGFRLGRPKNVAQIQAFCDVNRDGLIDGSQLSSIDPLIASDTLDSYEIGAKATIGTRTALRAAAYHNKWKDIPVSFRPPTCPLINVVFNAAEVEADGYEVEGGVYLGQGITIDFGVGYVLSRLSKSSPLGPEGALLNYAPKLNGRVGAEYRFESFGHDSFLRGDYSYYDEYYTGLGKTGTRFDSYGVLSVSAGMTFDRIDVRAFVDNVTGRYAITSDGGWPPNAIYPIRPRTIGVRLGYSF